MKKPVFMLLFFALLVVGFGTSNAWAAKALKGNWTFTIQTPMGALPVPVSFKNKGKGTLIGPGGALPLAYREGTDDFSLVFEGPGLAPDGSDLTFVVRGTKTDSTVTANAIILTDAVDPSSPAGFSILTTPITGQRQ